MIQADISSPASNSYAILHASTSTTIVNSSPITSSIIPILKLDYESKNHGTKHVTFDLHNLEATPSNVHVQHQRDIYRADFGKSSPDQDDAKSIRNLSLCDSKTNEYCKESGPLVSKQSNDFPGIIVTAFNSATNDVTTSLSCQTFEGPVSSKLDMGNVCLINTSTTISSVPVQSSCILSGSNKVETIPKTSSSPVSTASFREVANKTSKHPTSIFINHSQFSEVKNSTIMHSIRLGIA